MKDQQDHRAAVAHLGELSELARRGRSSIVDIGPTMAIWGVAIALAAFGEQMSQGSAFTVGAWTVALLLAYFGSLFMFRLTRSDQRAVTWRSRALHRIWVAAGGAIVIFNVGEELRRTGIQSESEAATALILAIAVIATAELTNRRLLMATGVGWLLVSLVLFGGVAERSLLPVLMIAAVVLQIVPGLLLMRSEWKA